MNEIFETVKISCPRCKTIKEIELPEYLFNQNNFKTVKVQVSEIICSHSFIVFLDPIKREVIGYEVIDKMFTIPAKEIKDFKEALSLRSIISLFGGYGAICLLHTLIYNYQVKILGKGLSDEKSELISNYFNEIKFKHIKHKFNISIIHDFYFLKPYVLNTLFNESLILDTNSNILHTPWENDLEFESSILKKALEVKNKEGEIEIIRNKVDNFLEEVNFSLKYLESIDTINKELLTKAIQEKFLNSHIISYGLPLLEEYLKRENKDLLNKIV